MIVRGWIVNGIRIISCSIFPCFVGLVRERDSESISWEENKVLQRESEHAWPAHPPGEDSHSCGHSRGVERPGKLMASHTMLPLLKVPKDSVLKLGDSDR